MAVNLSPVGGVAAQFFTNTGAVLTGGKLYTYAAGTTTPAATFTSSGGGTAWTNPIVLDAAGRVSGSGEIWLTDGINYKFVLKDSNDVLIATYDNITGINSNAVAYTNQQEIVTATAGQTVFNLSISYQVGTNSLSVFVDGVNQYGPGAQYAYTETDSDTVTFTSGLHVGAEVKFTTTQQQGAGAVDASQVSYTPAGTGAVTTNVQAKLRQTVSVKDFGAVGDGIVDDTVSLQNAINSVLANTDSDGNCGAVYIPNGVYKITSRLMISGGPGIHRGFTMFGESNGATIYNANTSGGHAIVMETALTGGNTEVVNLRNFTIEGNAASGRGISVGELAGFTRCNIEDLRVVNNGQHGIYGFYDATNQSAQIFITGCFINNNGLAGAYNQVDFGRVSVFRMLNTQVNTGTQHGLLIGGPTYLSDNIAITNSEFDAHTNSGVQIQNAQGTAISGSYSGTLTTNAWVFQAVEGLSMNGCWADDCSANGIVIQDSNAVSIEGCYIDLNVQTGIAMLASSGAQSNYGISVRNCKFIANASNTAYQSDIYVGSLYGGEITGNVLVGTTLAGVPITTNLYAIRLIIARNVVIKDNVSLQHQTSTVNINSVTNCFGNYIGPTSGNLSTTDPQTITCSDITDQQLKFANTTIYDMPFAVSPDGSATGRLKLAGPINLRQNWLQDPSATSNIATPQLQTGSLFLIPVSTSAPFTVANILKWRWGDEFTIIVQNNSGGVMGNVTWDTMYKGTSAFVKPTNGKASVATFVVFDGAAVYLKSVINDQ